MKFLADYSPSDQASLRNEICPDAHDGQIDYFLRVCHAKNIDPFSGLLYMQLRKNTKTLKVKAGVQPTVDGSRAAAARSDAYAGSDEPEFDSETNPAPVWCRVTVYRMVKGTRCAFTAKCRYAEFVPQAPNDFQWRSKPYHMLAKVTEVQALRKAFPETVSASGEDDYEAETEGTNAAQEAKDPEKAKMAVEWNNAINAFKDVGKKEADLLAKLSVARENVTLEHMDTLRVWYEELTRGS